MTDDDFITACGWVFDPDPICMNAFPHTRAWCGFASCPDD